MNSKAIPHLETLLQIVHEQGSCRWNDCIFLSPKKKHQDALFSIRLETKFSHNRILIAARTFEQAAEGATYLGQLSHKTNERMDLLRHCDWTKQNTRDDNDEERDNSWSDAFSTVQLITLLTSHPRRTVGFHHFTFSVEQSIVVAQHAVRIAFHDCWFTDGGQAFFRVVRNNTDDFTPLRALTLCHLPWDVTVWKQVLPIMRIDELNLECIAIDPEDAVFMSTVPKQLSLLRCQFSDQAQRLCQALAQTGGPQTMHLEDDAHPQAQSCWSNLLMCAVNHCFNVKTLGIKFPVTWNVTNHLPLVVHYMQGNATLERLILGNAQHPHLWSEAMHILSHQTSLKNLDMVDCPREHTDVLVSHLINVLTHNRHIQVQLRGEKGDYWRRVQQARIEPHLLYNRLHRFSRQCQQTKDQHHRMTLLNSALAKTTQQEAPARTQLLLLSNLDAFIAYLQR